MANKTATGYWITTLYMPLEWKKKYWDLFLKIVFGDCDVKDAVRNKGRISATMRLLIEEYVKAKGLSAIEEPQAEEPQVQDIPSPKQPAQDYKDEGLQEKT